MIFYVTLADRWMFSEYLEYWGRELSDARIRILHYEDLLRQAHYERGTYVFSTIDEVSPAMAGFIDELTARLRAIEGVTIFNDPRRVLRRFELHAELLRRGRSNFRSVRAAGELTGLRYPVFVRSERSHDGALSPLLPSESEVETWIGRAIALGRSLPDLMVVEFCETADAGGWYRKYAAFNVGKTIVPRSLSCGRDWVLKFAGNEFSRETAQEELDYVTANPHEKELHEIFEIAGVDYGRIDYSIRDGRVQTWEINLNPTIGRGLRPSSREIPLELRELREQTKERFYARFNEAWLRVDLANDPAAELVAVPIVIDPSTIDLALEAERRRWRSGSVLVGRAVRIARPFMKTAAAPLLRKLYRLPKRLVHRYGASLFRMLGKRSRARTPP